MQQRNNQLAVCAGSLVAFVCALFVRWYTITDRRAADFSRWPNIEMSGLHGNITFFFDVPIWLLLMASIFVTLLLASNIMGWTSISWWALLAGLVLPGLNYIIPMIIADGRVGVEIGPVLAIIATGAAFIILSGRIGVRRLSAVRGTPVSNL